MRHKFLLALNLQLFSEDGGADPGVDAAPAAEVTTGDPAPTPQAEASTEGTEPQNEPQNNFEKAFAKRLSAKQAEWETQKAEELRSYQDQLKDFTHYKKAAEYLQKSADISDIMSLTEQIELVELQERAEREQVPVSVIKRIDQLEAKEQEFNKWQEQQTFHSFRSSLEKFASDKGADPDELHQYMYDNQIVNPDIAHRALRAEQLEQKLTTAKEDAIKEYLGSKKAPRVEGSGAAMSQQPDTSKMSWDQIDRLAAERLRAAKNPT